MPCLNEAETIAGCITKAKTFIARAGIAGEVLVADNGRVLRRHRPAFQVMADADGSYDFSRLEGFVEKLRDGYDLVVGNRFPGQILPGAMPPLHRYLGNPLLTGIGRLFFGSACGDFHCGLRGFNRRSIEQLDLQTAGMEFASEMVVKATLHDLSVTEVPTVLAPDGRTRAPHLRSWRDGWRHLRFLLVFNPRWLFLHPGLALMTLGVALMLWLLPGARHVRGVAIDIHTLVYASGLILLGLQACLFSIFSKLFGINLRLLPPDRSFSRFVAFLSLERGLVAGFLLVILGMAGSIFAVIDWEEAAFGPQQPQELMRIVVPSLTSILVGAQIVLASFFISILQLKRIPDPSPDIHA